MKKITISLLLIIQVLAVSACQDEIQPINESYKFSDGDLGWTFEAVDYPSNVDKEEWQINSVVGTEDFTGNNTNAFWLYGNNHSDDIFLYVYKDIEGLKKDTTYNATINVDAVTPYGKESMGIGGSPAASVYAKAGLVTVEPKPEKREYQGSNYYLLPESIDKGQQSNGGEDLKLLGTLAGQTEAINGLYDLQYTLETIFTTSDAAEAWIIVGIDSGFEGLNIIGIQSVELDITAKEK